MIYLDRDQERVWQAIPADGSRLAYFDCRQRSGLRHEPMERLSAQLEAMGLVRYNAGLRTLQRVNPQPAIAAAAPLYLYHYRAIGGAAIPALHEGDLHDLGRRFQDSATPLIDVVQVDDPETLRRRFEAQLAATSVAQAGMRHSLRCNIETLSRRLEA